MNYYVSPHSSVLKDIKALLEYKRVSISHGNWSSDYLLKRLYDELNKKLGKDNYILRHDGPDKSSHTERTLFTLIIKAENNTNLKLKSLLESDY